MDNLKTKHARAYTHTGGSLWFITGKIIA